LVVLTRTKDYSEVNYRFRHSTVSTDYIMRLAPLNVMSQRFVKLMTACD